MVIRLSFFFFLMEVAFSILGRFAVLFRYVINSTSNQYILHVQGIGNSAQGFIDSVLFVAFTPVIRTNILKLFLCCCRRKLVKKPSLLHNESKNFYDNNLRNYSPRYSPYSSTPITIASTRISTSPEPSTSYQESPEKAYSIQTEEYTNYYTYY